MEEPMGRSVEPTQSTETYKNGKLIKFKSTTIQNMKKKYNELILEENKKKFKIKGSSYNGNAPSTVLVGNWWNHNILQSEMIISPLSGSLKFQEIYFLSKEILKINNTKRILCLDDIYLANTLFSELSVRNQIGLLF